MHLVSGKTFEKCAINAFYIRILSFLKDEELQNERKSKEDIRTEADRYAFFILICRLFQDNKPYFNASFHFEEPRAENFNVTLYYLV